MVEQDRHVHSQTSPAELTKTESRQADGKKVNQRVLVLSTGLALAAAIVAVLTFWALRF